MRCKERESSSRATGSGLSCRKRRMLSGLSWGLGDIKGSPFWERGSGAELILVIFLKIAVTFFAFLGFH